MNNVISTRVYGLVEAYIAVDLDQHGEKVRLQITDVTGTTHYLNRKQTMQLIALLKELEEAVDE